MLHDVRYAVRTLLKSPAFTAVAVITLALGIGANTAIFSVTYAVLLRQLPFREPDRVVALDNAYRVGFQAMSRPDFYRAAGNSPSLATVAEYHTTGVNYEGGAVVRRTSAAAVSATFLDVLGVPPVLGRSFLPGDDVSGSNGVALLSYRLWKASFHGDAAALGHTVQLNGNAFTVIGVLPAAMDFPAHVDVWTPTEFDRNSRLDEGGAIMPHLIARVRPGVSLAQAETELRARAPQASRDDLPVLTPLAAELTREVRPSLLMLTGAVALVLLIACANVAGLMLVRNAKRHGELAIRRALGASRWSLVRQQLAESVILAVLAGSAGILLAEWGLDLLYAIRGSSLAAFARPVIAWPVLGFALLISLLSAIAFGTPAAWIAGRQDPGAALKLATLRRSPRATRLRQGLVVFETALALVLLVGSGLLIHSMQKLAQVPLGFQTENLLTFSLAVHGTRYASDDGPASTVRFYSDALSRIEALPGVLSAAVTSNVPLGQRPDMLLPVTDGTRSVASFPRVVSAGYFRTLGLTLVAGRDFVSTDASGSDAVVVLTRDLAEKLWPSQDPLGRRVHIGLFDRDAMVVGIVAASGRQYGPRSNSYPTVYIPLAQTHWNMMTFMVRTQADPARLASAVRSAIAAVDAGQPIFDLTTMQQRVADDQSLERFQRLLLTMFAAMALLLAALGIYGVVSYTVAGCTREIGLRMALGASPRAILATTLREGALLVGLGAILGLAAAWPATQMLRAALFGITRHDPLTFAAMPLLLCLVAVAASYLPARRATKVDPMVALRYE